ncbi:MAG TPA: tetratricopeptide repeat protein, partial [Polyangia bacterium]
GRWAVDFAPSAAPSARQPAARTQGEEFAAAAPVMVAPGAAPALAPPPAQPALPTPAPSFSDAALDCGALATSKRTHEALGCYQARAAKTGLAGETAQYELARLLRDALGEPERALAAFRDQRARFPTGALRPEADLSIIELLPRLGRHSEALVETDKFLATHAPAERRGEIRLLRGNIFREVLHDLDKAEREYARGSESGGRTGDDCRFLHAVCLEALGRREDARQAYQTYLLRAGAAHVQEAKARLDHLRP